MLSFYSWRPLGTLKRLLSLLTAPILLANQLLPICLASPEEAQALSGFDISAPLRAGQRAVNAFLLSIGIAQVSQFEALLEAPAALSMCAHAQSTKSMSLSCPLQVVVGMVIDQLSLRGVEIKGCSQTSRKILTTQKIPLGHGKLVDVTLAGTKYETMKTVVTQLINDPETGALVVAIGSSAQFNLSLLTPIVDAVAEAKRKGSAGICLP